MQAASRSSKWALIPPPLVFGLALALGLLINSRFPIAGPKGAIAGGLEWLGIALIVTGIAHALTSVILFVINRTTIVPHQRASTFVQRGAYRWTRNPMYVGLTLVYVGICSVTATPWPLVFLPLPVLFVHRVVIPMEERHMQEAFGADYMAYRTRVRRWL